MIVSTNFLHHKKGNYNSTSLKFINKYFFNVLKIDHKKGNYISTSLKFINKHFFNVLKIEVFKRFHCKYEIYKMGIFSRHILKCGPYSQPYCQPYAQAVRHIHFNDIKYPIIHTSNCVWLCKILVYAVER